MVNVKFKINGREVRPDQVGDALTQEMCERVREDLVHQLRNVCE